MLRGAVAKLNGVHVLNDGGAGHTLGKAENQAVDVPGSLRNSSGACSTAVRCGVSQTREACGHG